MTPDRDPVTPAGQDGMAGDVVLIGGIPAVPTILDVVCRTTGMGFAAVARVTEERWVACGVLDHIGFGLTPGGELELESTICHEIRRTREPVVIDHVDGSAAYCDHHTPLRYGFQSYVSVPIILPGGRFFGTLCAIDPKPARLDTPEITGMFKLFAELIAFHIDASEKLAQSESQLGEERATAELREQFIGVLGHDLRNPLGAIGMGAAFLKRSNLDPTQAEVVDMMATSVTGMSDLIEDALDFTRGRLGGGITLGSLSEGSVEPVLRQVISQVRAIWPGREIGVNLALHGPVRHDRRRLAQLFTNLLSNALTHGKVNSPVTVRAESGGGKFELSVTNAADPIPPEVLTRLFEPFSRGGAADYGRGLGLGLYIASQIAKSHGGSLNVVSTDTEVSFTFTLATGP